MSDRLPWLRSTARPGWPSTTPATPEDLRSLVLRDEAEWLDACGAEYESVIARVAGARDPLSIIFVPFTGVAGVARSGEVRWLHATSVDDAVDRYLHGEGENALW